MPAVNSIANSRRFARHTLASVSMAALLMASATAAHAQSTLLDQLSVTAGLTPMQEKEIGRSYTVITAEQLDQSQARYVSDVLRQVPGFAVSRSGGYGTLTHIYSRGSEARQTLVLIDGVRVADSSDAAVDFSRYDLANVERIEILRGPQSAFWGADASAGVINIITKKGTRDSVTATVGSEFGTDGTRMGTASVSGGQDNLTASGSLSVRHTDGFNISSLGSELDGADHISGSASFTADVTPTLQIDGSVRYTRAFGMSDGQDYTSGIVLDTADTNLFEQLAGSFGAHWESDDDVWFQDARISGSGYTYENIGSLGLWRHGGERYVGSYKVGYNFDTLDFAQARHTVTAGYDFIHETFRDANTYQRNTHSLVGEYRGTFWDQLYLTAAVRHDFNEYFSDATTYSLSSAWQLDETGTRLHASVGTGSNKPTFFHLFGGVPGTYLGNPNLRPEGSLGWDVGVEQTFFDIFKLDATYFNATLTDRITRSAKSVANDIGVSHRQGIELAATLDLMNGFTVGSTYTYTDARNVDGTVAIRRPKHVASLDAAYTFEAIPLRLNASLNFNGEMLDDDLTTNSKTTLPAYSTVNLGLEYKVSDSVDIYGRIENLFDTRYQEVHGYNAPGRAAFVGVKAKIQ
jgi:vitamin B12 transporter